MTGKQASLLVLLAELTGWLLCGEAAGLGRMGYNCSVPLTVAVAFVTELLQQRCLAVGLMFVYSTVFWPSTSMNTASIGLFMTGSAASDGGRVHSEQCSEGARLSTASRAKQRQFVQV